MAGLSACFHCQVSPNASFPILRNVRQLEQEFTPQVACRKTATGLNCTITRTAGDRAGGKTLPLGSLLIKSGAGSLFRAEVRFSWESPKPKIFA